MGFSILDLVIEETFFPAEKESACFEETLWRCRHCGAGNLYRNTVCVKCGGANGDRASSLTEALDRQGEIVGRTEPKRLQGSYREKGMPYSVIFREGYQHGLFTEQSLMEYEAYVVQCRKNLVYQNKIRGCMLGGAAGDALGYPVEFMSLDAIRSMYGPKGIGAYWMDPRRKEALISDDTQMALFTASAVLCGQTRTKLGATVMSDSWYAYQAYLDWLATQVKEPSADYTVRLSGLVDEPKLWDRRAPGNTCLDALSSGACGSVGNPINNSKGCGGLMRVAPVALGVRGQYPSIEYLDRLGAEIAAITHGHSLGYMPAAMLVHIIHRAVYGGCVYGDSLRAIVNEALETVMEMFSQEEHLPVLVDIMQRAMKLAKNADSDEENIHRLGQGWVAEEALAIAVYCSLRYENNFSAGIIAAVNHDGDSDSTGAITGNILGAYLGIRAIDYKWQSDLELADLILETADDLCFGSPMEEYGKLWDPVWMEKYCRIGTKLNFERFEEE